MEEPAVAETEAEKPKRLFTKRITVLTLLWAMALATSALIFRPDLYEATLTWMVPLMLGAIGTYQGVGHADMRTQMQQRPPRHQEEPLFDE